MNPALLVVALAAFPLSAAPLPPARAASVQEPASRSEGQRLYDLGDYAGAAAWYRQALQNDPRDAALHYDLGNALFKSGQTGRAVASFQRAFDIRPRDADVRHNLDFALRRAGEELVPPGVPPLLFLAFHLFSERELAGLQWLALWPFGLLAGLCLWRSSLRPRLLGWTLAAGLLWSAAGLWWLGVRGATPPRRGVIVAASAEIRSGPGENFNVSFTAPEGRRAQILSENGGWLEIGMLKEGVKGWLPAAAVEEL